MYSILYECGEVYMWGTGRSLEAKIKSAFTYPSSLIQIGQLWGSTALIWGIICSSRRLAFPLLYSDTWTVSSGRRMNSIPTT